VLNNLSNSSRANAYQCDAEEIDLSKGKFLCSTDPPYYDNIGYADLSDFFYIWLKRSLNRTYPYLFSTILVPKSQELVANPHNFGKNKEQAKEFFETKLSKEDFEYRCISNL
jgi:putative DNA methylase